MYLLDTDVFSMTSPTSGFSGAEAEAWRDWVRRNESLLYFSVATIMEVRFAIEKSFAKGATKKAERLKYWLTIAETTHQARIIPVTIEIAHKAGELLYRAFADAIMPSAEDALIAATAEIKGYHLLSRNSKDMQALRARWIDPLETLPVGTVPRDPS
jgi:predicted nucleic acid-binding protein